MKKFSKNIKVYNFEPFVVNLVKAIDYRNILLLNSRASLEYYD